jgi:hypothetical protein
MQGFGIKQAIVVASSALLLGAIAPAGLASAQAVPSPDLVVRAPSVGAGNITFTGSAKEATTGQPATGVSVYDGVGPEAPYVADVSMGVAVEQASAPSPDEFSLILNSRVLSDGPHTLLFVARYPDGATAAESSSIVIENVPPYEEQESSSD